MKKKFISIAKKAMVWTMAASMLVATPLTASAQGLSDVFNVQDGWGNDVLDENGNKLGEASRTGTVTSTNTNTGYLKNSAEFDGIMIRPGDIVENYPKVKTKELSIVFTKEGKEVTLKPELQEAVQGKFTWKSSKTSVATFAPVAVPGKTDKMTLRINGGGEATITASFDDYVNDIHYADTIDVLITQKADWLRFNPLIKTDAYAGVSLDLNEYLEKPAGATDNVTFAIVENSKHAATLKNGVLKLNAKSEPETESVKIVAIGDEVRSDVTTLTIHKAVASKAATFTIKGAEVPNKGHTWTINTDTLTVGCEVTLFGDKKKSADNKSTDRVVSWTSNKPDIVAVKGDDRDETKNPNGWKATLTAGSTGTAQITAKTARGNSFKVKVTVKANLAALDFSEKAMSAYSGQMVQLKADQYFGPDNNKKQYVNFTEASVKWEIPEAAERNVASVNKKTGVLTIKPSLTYRNKKTKQDETINKITVQVSDSKKDSSVSPATITVNLKQIDISEIAVYSDPNPETRKVIYQGALNAKGTKFAATTKFNAKKTPITVAVGDTTTLTLYAKGQVDGKDVSTEEAVSALGWTVNNTKLAKATKSQTSGNIEGVKKGSPVITVSASTKVKSGKSYKYVATKVTMKATVTQPSETIQLSTTNTGVRKGQTVTIKTTLDKGATTKAGDIEWTLTDVTDPNATKAITTPATLVKNKKFKVTQDPGTVILVRARVKQTGASASMRIKVVEKSTKAKVIIASNKEGTKFTGNKFTLDVTDIKTAAQKDQFIKMATVYPLVNGTTSVADSKKADIVTYTVSKPNYVRIVQNEDGTITLNPLQNTPKAGIKITPVTSDGVKGTPLTLIIKGVELQTDAATAPYSIE